LGGKNETYLKNEDKGKSVPCKLAERDTFSRCRLLIEQSDLRATFCHGQQLS
jgi:hypothetical protein